MQRTTFLMRHKLVALRPGLCLSLFTGLAICCFNPAFAEPPVAGTSGQVAQQPQDGEVPADAERILGEWVPVEFIFLGLPVPMENIAGLKVVFEKEELKLYPPAPVRKLKEGELPPPAPTPIKFRYQLLTDREPHQIELTAEEGPQQGQTTGSIYQFDEKGRLVICGHLDPAAPRPDVFESTDTSRTILFKFEQHVKPASTPEK
ncbi:hypothetical protein Plim_3833 [Planctopirus limnophila DSM 3776]|uniref:TIGR03067 domain-containing protein n=1 Tax=Planctopirus limnophila (strain ATCC 43296 / DSM 3776 / IFAM 1008 / Mu 290) TaxID=521674 RepID=D5SX23_PLAL2|nr:TIGR03067 domain-containing protein [Planctopirus limnophila]ADG69645.1 hypothetical protein Plim_3833 [Planctopirus limnophila DSM 3776]